MPSYPSSLTDAEWKFVRDMVPQSRPSEGRGRPCTWSKREILDAIFYVVRGGIQWRMIPNDLPPWKTVYHYFREWSKEGIWIGIHDALRDFARQMHGKKKPRPLRYSTARAFAQLAKPEYVAMMLERRWSEESDTF